MGAGPAGLPLTPDIQAQVAQLQQQLQSLQARVVENETVLRHHHHTGYDSSQQLLEQSGEQSVYAGAVSYTGSAISLPAGWTCQKNSNGVFQVNHALGSANYFVVVTMRDLPVASDLAVYTVSATGATSFVVQFDYPSGSFAVNTDFNFIVALKQ